MPKPFIKWAGGKRRLVDAIKEYAPRVYGTYYEPFLGGGALFFELKPRWAVLSDINLRLIRTYKAVRDNVEGVITKLQDMLPVTKETYVKIAKAPVDEYSDDADVAAWLIFLTKTSFNGLYRVNKRNEFNVPFNGKTNVLSLCDEDNLRKCSRALQRADIVHCDFENSVEMAGFTDLIYLDPPYIPTSSTAKFASYDSSGFSLADHERLKKWVIKLRDRACFVIESNSDTETTRILYPESLFRITEVSVPRGMNKAKCYELLIR